eukprot:UN04474
MSKKRSYSTMSCGSSHITCTEPSDWCNDPTLKQPPNKRRRLNTQTNRRNYQQHNSEKLNGTTTKTKDTHKKMIEKITEIPSPTKLIAMDIQTEEHLDELFRIGSVKREKAINLFRKILSKIVSFPNEEKYQSLNHAILFSILVFMHFVNIIDSQWNSTYFFIYSEFPILFHHNRHNKHVKLSI